MPTVLLQSLVADRAPAERPLEGETQPSDESLVTSARAGDRRAFSILYQRYVRTIHAVVLSRVSVSDSSDLVQDVFVTAMRRLPSLRDPRAFGGWLISIARNHVTDHHRRPHHTHEVPDAGRAPPPSAEAAEVLAAIGELPEAYRETLLMRLVEGMSGPEIAARTGLAPGSVRVNLHRGMMMLRRKLGWESER